MAQQPGSMELLELGSLLSVVATRGETPIAIAATLRSREPLMVTASFDPGLRKGETVLLLGQNGQEMCKAMATVTGKGRTGSQIVLHLQTNQWETAERRRSARTEVELECDFLAVTEAEDGAMSYSRFEGKLLDLSRTGARIQTSDMQPIGALVQWQFSINGASARGLAMVVSHYDPQTLALDFIEFSGSAYGLICSYLQDLAA